MYRGLSVIAIAPVLNEEVKVGDVVRRTPRPLVDSVLVVDDGSTDRSVEVARSLGARVHSMGRVAGVGAAIRAGYRIAVDEGFDVAVVMAGNNKDSPEEIPILLDPIVEGRADFVQGSRFLKRDRNFGPMPLYRRVATRIHPLIFSWVAGRRVTESTNGFRAIRTQVLADPRLDLEQEWLDEYELEPYLYIRTIRLNYRTAEVPVTKIYPPRSLGQTKMKPITGWWSMLRPLFFLGLRMRR
ncbi:glycosyltransferase family 2 protein [Myxococcota bacterium]|nr:glycosyltransferase family 2 protein [Myxococcota bacterium]